MTPNELNQWVADHGGIAGRDKTFKSVPTLDRAGYPVPGSNVQVESGVVLTARDGAKLELRRSENPTTVSTAAGENDEYEVVNTQEPPRHEATPQTPDQARVTAAQAASAEITTQQAQAEADERKWNANPANVPLGASGLPETHLERSTREAKAAADQRAQQQLQIQLDNEKRQQAIDARNAENDRLDREQRQREFGVTSGISQANLDITRAREQREANKPDFLSQADTKTPNITKYNPATGAIESIPNPNYDAVRAAAEERRAELTSQIAARQITLDEAKASYSQWFDTNVKTPIMMAEEQRAKAAEQRAALDAEERRRQFAADFGLRKATLGQQAAATAIQAEESLLPYRAGPNEAAHMADAINGLAAGGIVGGPSAGAGIHFAGEDFQFNAPDFKSIAKQATKAVLSGLTDYRPSDQQYQTADYTGVPAVNLSSMPAMPSVGSYSYPTSSPLPAPSPGADQPAG